MTISTVNHQSKKIDELHFEHGIWIKELKFNKEELKIFSNRLSEVGVRYTSTAVLARLDQFQNKFMVQQEAADTLLQDLNVHEQKLNAAALINSISIDRISFSEHYQMRARMETFEKIFRQLRNDYLRYLSETM